MLIPLFVDVSASGDVTTRNQQVAQVISADDKTLYLTQKVVTVRMLGDISVANGTYTPHHKVGSGQVDEKVLQVFERAVCWVGYASTSAHDSAAGRGYKEKVTPRLKRLSHLPNPSPTRGRSRG